MVSTAYSFVEIMVLFCKCEDIHIIIIIFLVERHMYIS